MHELQDFVESYVTERYPAGATSVFETVKPDTLMRVSVAATHGSRDELIAKLTTAAEARALQLLNRAAIAGVPSLLAHRSSTAGTLVLLPQYRGGHGDFGDRLPTSILETLAHVHANFADAALPLTTTNEKSMAELWNYALANLDAYPSNSARLALTAVRDALDAFVGVLGTFPATLVNWDVHPGNIVVAGDASVLIDWGLARCGPGMIDLANLVPWDSDDLRIYARAFARHAAKPFDFSAKRLEYDWARAVTQIKYLRYAAEFSDIAHVERMADIACWYARSIV